MARPGAPATLSIPRPDDFHVHLRQGPSLVAYARREAAHFGRALCMPNTLPPLVDSRGLGAYREAILAATEGHGFEPLLAFKLLPGMTAAAVRDCASAGAIAGKLYPAGATTNSQDGVSSEAQVEEALEAMEEEGLILSIHGEEPAAPSLDREVAFLPRLAALIDGHPRLRIVLEHVSTKAALDFVLSGPPNLGATLTAHHLLLTLEDLLGEGLVAGLFCKPVLKSAADRRALQEAAFAGHPRLFFGSDSAPHPRAAKEGGRASAGIYAAPTALGALAGLFDEAGALDQLGPFLGERGAAFYGLPPPQGRLGLVREAWRVPDEMDGALPLLAGGTLAWRVVGADPGVEES